MRAVLQWVQQSELKPMDAAEQLGASVTQLTEILGGQIDRCTIEQLVLTLSNVGMRVAGIVGIRTILRIIHIMLNHISGNHGAHRAPRIDPRMMIFLKRHRVDGATSSTSSTGPLCPSTLSAE